MGRTGSACSQLARNLPIRTGCATDDAPTLSAKAVELFLQEGFHLREALGCRIEAVPGSTELLVVEQRAAASAQALPVALGFLEPRDGTLGVQMSMNPLRAKPVQPTPLYPATHDACITQSHDPLQVQVKCRSHAGATHHG